MNNIKKLEQKEKDYFELHFLSGAVWSGKSFQIVHHLAMAGYDAEEPVEVININDTLRSILNSYYKKKTTNIYIMDDVYEGLKEYKNIFNNNKTKELKNV